MTQNVSDKALAIIKKMQQSELTESVIYEKISRFAKGEENKAALQRLAAEEKGHYQIWKKYTGLDMKPETGKVLKYVFLARTLGFTFAVKLMERGEENAQEEYALLAEEVAESIAIRNQEEEHEQTLLAMLDEERLQYVGSMVLGLNDALVELTGSLAGFAFALQNNRLIALSGLIVGISGCPQRRPQRCSEILLLYRYCLSAYRHRPDRPLSAAAGRKLYPGPCLYAGCGDSDHRRLHLLYLRCPGRTF